MAMSLTYLSKSREREQILNQFQEITGLNIDDASVFLGQYDWKLDIIINEYYNGIELNQKLNHNPSLGRFYAVADPTKQQHEDSHRHYSDLLNSYEQQQELPIYHEKQRLMRCGLHSLNNLFQIPKLFTRHHLESIVREYDKRTIFNDYRTLWWGNYDLRILIEAINRCGFDVKQIDLYNESFHRFSWNKYFGLLINLNGKHWFTVKNLNGIYYNLDSTLRKPIQIGKEKNLIEYLFHLINRTHMVYLFVVTQQHK